MIAGLQSTIAHALLAATVFGAAASACGGAATRPQTPAPETASSGSPSSGAAAVTPASPGTAAKDAPEKAPQAPAKSVEIVPSKMAAEVKALGIDLMNAGELGKLDMSKKKKLMPLFVKALGMSGCDGCHVVGDFKADTLDKRMATSMWNHFVKDLRAKGGGPLFCDSCHQGKSQLLARTDKKALSAFMTANYEEKLERANKKDHNCETCHSDPFEGKVFAKLWKVDTGTHVQ
ncbi:MAG TPA: hypothetical protein VJT73_05350 [Polyangiaceae bacterium]|nr:hypothetical protein [Polyangiaceae bacterium]